MRLLFAVTAMAEVDSVSEQTAQRKGASAHGGPMETEMTPTMTTASPLTTIGDIVDAAREWTDHQVLLSQGRCVDVLLDLYVATDDVGLRWSIADRLDEIRFVNAVDACEFRADLAAIVAIASLSALGEPEWTSVALAGCGALAA